MKDKVLLPSALAGLLQAILLFLAMDLFYVHSLSDPGNVVISFFYDIDIRFMPFILAVFFGSCYAAPMLLFTKKRNMLFYYLSCLGFFLVFSGIFFLVTYILPQNVAHMSPEVAEAIDIEHAGFYFGIVLLLFSADYFIYAALAKLAAHLVFLGIPLIKTIRTRRNIHS